MPPLRRITICSPEARASITTAHSLKATRIRTAYAKADPRAMLKPCSPLLQHPRNTRRLPGEYPVDEVLMSSYGRHTGGIRQTYGRYTRGPEAVERSLPSS